MAGPYPSFLSGRRRLSFAMIVCMIVPLFAGCTGLGGPPEPTARIKADREEINVGESVNFDARESTSPDGTIVSKYKWNFGDGKSDESTQGYISHTFTEPGYYEVEVTAENDEGGVDTASTNLFVNGFPEISLTKPTAIRTGDMITLDASGSSDPEGSSLTFTWISNWISEEESQSMNSIYTFIPETSGNYSGTVTVADERGATASQAWSVAVLPRTYQIIWEEHTVTYEWDGVLEQGERHNESVIPSDARTGILMSVDATLTLAMDFFIQAPQDNFTLTAENRQDGWKQRNSTQQENITKNSTTRIFEDNFNSIPNADNITADSLEVLIDILLNQSNSRFGQGEWIWIIEADECDPDFINEADPDPDNGWELVVEYTILVPRISEVGV